MAVVKLLYTHLLFSKYNWLKWKNHHNQDLVNNVDILEQLQAWHNSIFSSAATVRVSISGVDGRRDAHPLDRDANRTTDATLSSGDGCWGRDHYSMGVIVGTVPGTTILLEWTTSLDTSS